MLQNNIFKINMQFLQSIKYFIFDVDYNKNYILCMYHYIQESPSFIRIFCEKM